MTNVRRAISLLLQYPQFANEFSELAIISPEQIRGIDLVHQLYDLCIQNPEISTAALLERFRDRSFFGTLSQLAHHRHNDLDELSDEEALILIRANNQKLSQENAEGALEEATRQLEALTAKSAVAELSEAELKRKDSLSVFLREQYKS